jgi:signal transduction histidine kinase
MRQPSLRRTLLIGCGIGVSLLLCLLSVGVFLLVKHSLYRELDESISQTAALLSNQIELENEHLSFEWKEGMGTNNALIEDGIFQFWNEKTGGTTRSPGLRNLDLPRFTAEGGGPKTRTVILPDGHRARAIGLRVYPFVLPEELEQMKQRGRIIDPKTLPHVLVVARDSEPVHHTLNRLRWILIGGNVLTLALGFALIDRVVRASLRPIDELNQQMKNRAGSRLDSALEVPGRLPVELVGLAENFDSLLARVAAFRQRERDFIRHAAHELRTPIAGLQATTELALSQKRDAATYASYLETCRASSTELAELVKRLTALARIGQSGSSPTRENLDARTLLEGCLARFKSVFARRGIRLETQLSENLGFSGDATLVRIIFNNLLDNAACYASPDSVVHVLGTTVEDKVEIRISNQTQELPDDTDRLFEPLFRKEISRNDSSTHLGIGLTLSQEAANAMAATLSAQTPAEGWLEFTLQLPAAS